MGVKRFKFDVIDNGFWELQVRLGMGDNDEFNTQGTVLQLFGEIF